MELLLHDITTATIYNITTDPVHNVTTAPASNGPAYLGFLAAGVAIFFFGTAFLPIKKFEPSDGIFYQWILANGILVVGIVVNLIRGCPQFYPLTMLGGAIWALGNVCVVSIMKTIGMGLGICLWSVTNILGGWSSGRFGLFGTNAHIPHNAAMNYVGVSLAALSAIVYSQIKPRLPDMELIIVRNDDEEQAPLLGNNISAQARQSVTENIINSTASPYCDHRPFYERLPPLVQRFYGIILSLASGLLYGFSFTPSIYIQDNYPHASQNGLDYVLAQFVGIYLMSLLIFIVYLLGFRNRPVINNQIILPSLVGGVMWGIACTAWFVANQILSETISFPIICAGPTIVANLFTVFMFREITARRDLMILSLGFAVTITACILTGLSL